MALLVCDGVMVYEAIANKIALHRSLWLVALVVGLATGASDVLAALAGPSKWYVCFVAAAFGAQNALSGSEKVLGVNTTIMTGNLQKVGAALTLCLLRKPVPAKQARSIAGDTVYWSNLGVYVGELVPRYPYVGAHVPEVHFARALPQAVLRTRTRHNRRP